MVYFNARFANKLNVKYGVRATIVTFAELSRTTGLKSDLVQAATDSDSVQQLTAVVAQIGEHSKGIP